jgi:hemerythrin superfamily protein
MVESNFSIVDDGIQLLQHEHNMIRQLFDSWHQTHSQNERNIIVEKFIREICIHASCEERYVYPLIEQKIHGFGKILGDRNYLDDQLNKEMLQFLMDYVNNQKSDMDRSIFNKVVEKFIYIETNHLKQEEEDVFPILRLSLTSHELKEMYDNLNSGRLNSPTHPHPNAPMKFGSKLLHPIAGALDKLMDMGGHFATGGEGEVYKQEEEQQTVQPSSATTTMSSSDVVESGTTGPSTTTFRDVNLRTDSSIE